MIETLKGSALWAVVLIVLGVIGSTTYLASQGILSGADMLTLITLILTGVVGTTAAHVAGQTAAAAFNTPASGTGTASNPSTTPGPAPDAPTEAISVAPPGPNTRTI